MENEIAEAKGEERRVEKSSREARDTLALSQTERAEPTLPALTIYLSRVRLQHSPHITLTSHTAILILSSTAIYSNRFTVCISPDYLLPLPLDPGAPSFSPSPWTKQRRRRFLPFLPLFQQRFLGL